MAPAEITLQSRCGTWTRRAWFARGPDAPHRAGIMLDGEFVLERVGAWPIIERLTAEGALPAMSWLFVESGGPAARHADYQYVDAFDRFVADEVLGWIGERAPLVDAGHLIGGLSLSGLAAATIAVAYGDRFSAALCQSGSFWIRPADFAAHVAAHRVDDTRFWLSVGDEETVVGVSHPPSGIYQDITQIDGVERALAALRSGGAAVHHHVYAGGHTFAPWTAELADALRWLLVPDGR